MQNIPIYQFTPEMIQAMLMQGMYQPIEQANPYTNMIDPNTQLALSDNQQRYVDQLTPSNLYQAGTGKNLKTMPTVTQADSPMARRYMSEYEQQQLKGIAQRYQDLNKARKNITGAPTGGAAPISYDINNIGRYGAGNIDLYNRPQVKNPDGSISTVRSMSFNDGTNEVLIPTVVGNSIVSPNEAIDNYFKTGQYLGKFNTPEEADSYANILHEQQANYYMNR